MFHDEPTALDGVSMLLFEVHISMKLKMSGVGVDLRKFQDFFEYLLEVEGFRFFYHHANQGWHHPPAAMVELGASPRVCCYEIGLYRELS